MNLQHLSDVQRRAVTTVDGPVLVLAGAGSGKTSVLTNRVAYLINEMNVSPYNILAITFTNKAANEMKERIAALVDYDISRMAVSTFHSLCARFLRHDAELLGYMNNFTIYDRVDVSNYSVILYFFLSVCYLMSRDFSKPEKNVLNNITI